MCVTVPLCGKVSDFFFFYCFVERSHVCATRTDIPHRVGVYWGRISVAVCVAGERRALHMCASVSAPECVSERRQGKFLRHMETPLFIHAF